MDAADHQIPRKLILTLAVLAMVGPFSADMYLPAFPELLKEFDTSAAQIQVTLGLFVLGMGLGQLWWGIYSDAAGRRRPLLISTTAFALVSLGAVLAPNLFVFSVMRLLQGFFGAAGVVIGRAIARDLSNGTRLAKVLSVLGIIMAIAPVAAPVLGGVVAEHFGWRMIMSCLVGLGVIMMTMTVAFIPESLDRSQRSTLSVRGYRETLDVLLRDRSFIGYTLMMVFGFCVLFAFVSGSSFVLQDQYGLRPTQYSLCIGINALGLITAGVINTRLVGRVSPRKILTFVMFQVMFATLINLILVLTLHEPWFVLWLVFVMLSTAAGPVTVANATMLALHRHGAHAGSASAVMGCLQFIMAGVVSVLVAVHGVPTVLSVTIVMVSCGTIAFLADRFIAPRQNDVAR